MGRKFQKRLLNPVMVYYYSLECCEVSQVRGGSAPALKVRRLMR